MKEQKTPADCYTLLRAMRAILVKQLREIDGILEADNPSDDYRLQRSKATGAIRIGWAPPDDDEWETIIGIDE